MSSSIWRMLFYLFIGDTLASAIRGGSKGLLFIAIAGAFIGLMWLYPLFKPEEKRDI